MIEDENHNLKVVIKCKLYFEGKTITTLNHWPSGQFTCSKCVKDSSLKSSLESIELSKHSSRIEVFVSTTYRIFFIFVILSFLVLGKAKTALEKRFDDSTSKEYLTTILNLTLNYNIWLKHLPYIQL